MTSIKKQILLIEDDLIDQMAFTRMFDRKMKDYSYHIANSVQAAKTQLISFDFDLVISDFNLADGTTLDLIKELGNIPLIIITGNEDDELLAKAKQEFRAVACFTKDLELSYLEKLPSTIISILKKDDLKTKDDLVSSIKGKEEMCGSNLQFDMSKLFYIFDGNKNLVKETIEVFVNQKEKELDALEQNIFVEKNCHEVKKLVHKMQSGFRILNMKHQENTAGEIEKLAGRENQTECLSKVKALFDELSLDTKKAIFLLQQELKTL